MNVLGFLFQNSPPASFAHIEVDIHQAHGISVGDHLALVLDAVDSLSQIPVDLDFHGIPKTKIFSATSVVSTRIFCSKK